MHKVRLTDNPDKTPRWTGDGVEGVGKGAVKVWSKLDIVAADRRPLPPAAQPATHPIVANRVNEHWQAGTFGYGVPARLCACCWEGTSVSACAHCERITCG